MGVLLHIIDDWQSYLLPSSSGNATSLYSRAISSTRPCFSTRLHICPLARILMAMEGTDIQARSAPSLPHPHGFDATESQFLRCNWVGCGEIFDSAASLHGHLCDVHVGNSVSRNHTLYCMWDGCKNTAPKRSRMLSHLLVHVPLRRHPCGECGKRFKWLNDLKKHLHKPKPCVARRRASAAADRPESAGQQQEDVRDFSVQVPRALPFEPRLHDHLPLRPASVVHIDPESLDSGNLTPPILENPIPSPIGDENITDANSDAGPYPSVAEMQAFVATDFDILELYLTSPSNAEWCSTRNPGGPVMDGAGYSPEAPSWSKDDHTTNASTISPPTMQPRMQSLSLSPSSEERGYELLPVGSTGKRA